MNFVDSFFDSDDGVDIPEIEVSLQEQIQESVNAVMLNPSNCSRIGVGKDGKLLCRFLGGEKETCTFKHPQSDISLKGTGVSNETTMPSTFRKQSPPGTFKKQPTSGKVHSIQEEFGAELEGHAEDGE